MSQHHRLKVPQGATFQWSWTASGRTSRPASGEHLGLSASIVSHGTHTALRAAFFGQPAQTGS